MLMPTHSFTCTASTEYDSRYRCSNVYDLNRATDWATRGQGADGWIEIQFNDPSNFNVQISKIETRHRTGGSVSGDNFKDITLSFSDGTNQSAILQDGTDPEWNVIKMSSLVKTRSIKILCTSMQSSVVLNPGFSEIRFYGCPGIVEKTLRCNKNNEIPSSLIYFAARLY